ncbi:gamma-glutamylcyclotransferase family protein [Parachlamydia sp. AcF125]|uniref:gamma-glutamylcyclotransferase family protein n=1 Tax=Parachlamydia sp. AcF125 TaxID=2795736 RepID=UPI001BC99F8F|nr:gamma-glutamylcyclotransferase family protein [Parachlamydia sp. AcF125]MBS4167588.1 hypothetical protein [Parachlamydia sp. AcF125]
MQLSSDLPHLYFAYGSNLSYEFLKERLKNGEWLDEWHREGVLEGQPPLDLGTYILDDYEFSYSLNVTPFGEEGTSGNIIPKKGSQVYGVVYQLSDAHLAELDRTEDIPEAYKRVAVQVHKCATKVLGNFPLGESLTAWVYVGNSKYIQIEENPNREYVNLLIHSAFERLFPREYIDQYLQAKYPNEILESATV